MRPEISPRDVTRELQATLRSLSRAVTSVAGGDTARELVAPLRRQTELFQEMIDAERRLQREVAGRVLAPLDAVFDLLEESGKTFRAQAEALEQASAALAQTAKLMQTQAEIYEGTIGALREPTALARRVAGAKPKQRNAPGKPKKPAKKRS